MAIRRQVNKILKFMPSNTRAFNPQRLMIKLQDPCMPVSREESEITQQVCLQVIVGDLVATSVKPRGYLGEEIFGENLQYVVCPHL